MSLRSNNIEKFWDWFSDNEKRLQAIEFRGDPLLKLANFKLCEVCAGINLVLSAGDKDKEVVISANGIKEKFSIVNEIVTAAPASIDRNWKVVAFKQPQGFPVKAVYGDVAIFPEELWFIPLKKKVDPNFLGLQIGIPDYNEKDRSDFRNGVYEVFEIALGEVFFHQAIDYLDVSVLPNDLSGWVKVIDVLDYLQNR